VVLNHSLCKMQNGSNLIKFFGVEPTNVEILDLIWVLNLQLIIR
jgi:hypothetical protein